MGQLRMQTRVWMTGQTFNFLHATQDALAIRLFYGFKEAYKSVFNPGFQGGIRLNFIIDGQHVKQNRPVCRQMLTGQLERTTITRLAIPSIA